MAYLPALWRAHSTGTYTPPSGITRTSDVNSGYLFFLPRPVLSLPTEMSWKGKVEQLNAKHGGNAVRGNYLGSSMTTVTGKMQIARVGTSDTTQVTDSDMFLLWYDLADFLRPTDTTVKFELFWWYDASGGGTYRKWKDVEKAGLVTDGGDNNYNPPCFGYSLQLHLVNPLIYTTAPGA